jgi:NTE family protein
LYGGIDYVYIENRGFKTKNLSSMVDFSEKLKDNGKNALSFNFKYSVNTLELPDFPRSGVLFSVKNDFLLPLGSGKEKQFCNFIEGNFSVAIPLSKKLTVIGDLSAGTECLQNIVSMPNLFVSYGYNYGSRLFFPQFPNDYEYGTHGFQGMLTLQFSPWDNLTLLGGKIYFSYFVAGGNLWTSYEKILSDFYDNMQWNTGLQVGVNIKKSFNIFLRGGIGTYGDRIVPFLSFDIGSLRM